jgi:hypothetical protein
MPMEVHSASVHKWRLPLGFWLNNGLSPQEASVATLCRVLHHQWLNLFTIISSPRKLAECLYCDVSPPPILPVLSCFIESPVIYSSYNHTFIQSYINTFTYSYIHIYITHTQYQFIHGCISHPKSCLVVSFRLSPQSFQAASPKQRTA